MSIGEPINYHPKNREEWLVERRKGIGGSEASCILGLNPWKTNQQLYDEKTGAVEIEDISNQSQVVYGKECEEYIRGLFACDNVDKYQVSYDEFEMVSNLKEYPWLYATLDGTLYNKETKEFGVLEIKTTTVINPSQWDKWQDQVPDYYYTQILHQLLANQYKFAILRADIRHYTKEGELRHTIRDYYFDLNTGTVKDDMQYLLEKEFEFYTNLKMNKRPPALLPMI